MGLELRPIGLREAQEFVGEHHRHHKPSIGHKFSIAAYSDGKLIGVAMVGRPVSRYFDNGLVLEVNRLCTDGTRNACSFLYGAAWRAAQALGYKGIVTYTLESEHGSSLRASNWICDGKAGGTHWAGERYQQTEIVIGEMKNRWHKGIVESKKGDCDQ